MKSLIKSIVFFSLFVCVVFTGCSSDKKDSTESSDVKNEEVDVENAGDENQNSSDEAVEGEQEIDVKLINSTGEEVNLWIGEDGEISDDNKLEGGGVKDEKLTFDVTAGSDGALSIEGNITVGVGKDGQEVKTEELAVSGEYVDKKPIVVFWQGENLELEY
jgi:hypothetical protein